jgi:hypothetical protein
VAECPECSRVFGPAAVVIPPRNENAQRIQDEMRNGGTRPGEPPGRGLQSPPRIVERPSRRLGVPMAPGGTSETLEPAREIPLAESPFVGRPTDPEEGDMATPDK